MLENQLNIIYNDWRDWRISLYVKIFVYTIFIQCEITEFLWLYNRTYRSNKYILYNLSITIMEDNFDSDDQLMIEIFSETKKVTNNLTSNL